ncbi:hypothetical protein [Vibrio harveyi]|uniref:hypothetical protein n=1 Tax=Vibrio harveyi TaxID=669 RepID=UPI003735E3B0
MELTLSDVGAILSAVFAGGALFHSVMTHRKQKDLVRELGNLQREIAVLELKDAKEREISKEKAEFNARFVSYGNGKRLVITNVGSSQARDVKIDFGGNVQFVLSQEVDRYFPCDLNSSESVKLIATMAIGHDAVRESFTLSWMDNAGGGQKDFSVQY